MRADVLVIGGGIAGAATAYYLARAGADVILIERGEVSAEASGANSGSLHAQIPFEPFALNGPAWAEAFAPTLRLMTDSITLWRELEAELGIDLDVATPGGLIVARSESQMRLVRAKAAVERAQGLDVTLLDREGLRGLAPYISDRMIGGAFCAGEGKANPLIAGAAFARAAASAGARVMRFTALEGLMSDADGFIAATSAGPIRAGRVVNCAGAAAGRVAAMVGLDLPVEAHAIQTTVTEPVAPLIPHLVYSADEKLSLKQNALGMLLIGGGWPAELDGQGRPVVSLRSLAANMQVAIDAAPAIAGVQIVRSWAAIVNGTADWRPILGEAPGVPGFLMAFFPWMGFTAGPLVGRAIADLALGRRPSHDISAFAPGA